MAGILETLLHFDGANGSQTFTDATGKHTWVSYAFAAGPAIDTSQFKFGASSLALLTISGECIICNDAFSWGSGAFTIDFWMRLNGTQTGQQNVFLFNNPTGIIYISAPGNPLSFYYNSVAITGTTNVTTSVWHHVALTYDGAKTYLFLDGNLEGIWNSGAVSWSSPAIYPQIRQPGNSTPTCWVDELRISLGAADWTANFTPPIAPYVISSGLPADPGIFAFTGIAAGTVRSYVLPLVSGAFTLTGIAASSSQTYVMPCSTGAFVFTGINANLVYSGGQAVSSGRGMPVVTVLSGGIPVVDVSSLGPNAGAPVSEAAPGRGIPVTKVSKFGTPVVYI